MTQRTKTRKKKPEGPEALTAFCEAVEESGDWFAALLVAIAEWEMTEEEVAGRHYQYLIGGEAFDWLLLAERLCNAADGAIPIDEKEALLFFGKPPQPLDDEDFRKAIGDSKHRAHLNFLYGVAVEEALQLAAEEEVLKRWRSSGGWNRGENLDQQVFGRLYNRSRDEMLAAYRAGQLPSHEVEMSDAPIDVEISFGELRAFTYWLFKYRVIQSDPARVASDTRKALVQLSELEVAARRRAQYLAAPRTDNRVVLEGEVVSRSR